MHDCMLCNTEHAPPGKHTCEWCTVDTCFKCTASAITRDGREITCSHGCEYPIDEHITYTYYTILLNGTPEEKLAVSGPEIEVIIPNGTPITVHETRPDDDAIPDSHVSLLHYTHDKQAVLNEGIVYPPNENSRDSETPEWARDTIRYNAVYAWPFDSSFVDTFGAFKNSDATDPVYLTVNEHDAFVSSYNFLKCIHDTDDPDMYSLTNDDITGIRFPPEKYESELVFDIDAFRRAVTEYERPCSTEQLLI